jgi:hypothetical protein
MTRKRHTEEQIIVVLKAHSTIGDVTPQEFITNYQNGAQLRQECTSSALV